MAESGTLLIVDDNPDNLEVLGGILEQAGFKVRPALSGEIALRAIEVDTPDLILLDIRMPGIDGYETCKRLKANERTREIPVIFISAMHEIEDKLTAFRAGGVDYVTKPFQEEEVLARVQAHIELYRIKRHLERLVQERTSALAESEARYRRLFEANPHPMWVHDSETLAFLAINDAAVAHYGWSREEFLAMTVSDIHRESDIPCLLDYFSAGKEEKVRMRDGWKHRKRDGTLIDVEISSHPLDFDGRRGWIVSTHDVTERKRAEEALRKSEQKYRELVENANSIILRWNPKGEITFLNEFGLQFFGYTEEEILGRPAVGTIVAERESTGRDLKPLVDGIAADPKAFEQNINENMRRNGERIWISWTNKAVLDSDGHLSEILSIGSDITERVRASQRERDDAKRMRALSRRLITAQETERRAIARELHDEAGQVLTAVNTMLQLMKGKISDAALGGQLDEGIWLVNRAIDDIRNVSLRLRPAILDDLGLIPALRWLVTQQSVATGIEIALELGELPSDVPPDIATGCFRIVQEAITNAIRHSRADRLKVRLREADNRIEVEIQDNGVGFHRAKARERAAQGHGSGLSGMRERAELLGGSWEVRSTPGAGTLIHASLPL